MFRRILLSIAVIGFFAAYAIQLKFKHTGFATVNIKTPTPTPLRSPTPLVIQDSPSPTLVASPTPRGKYKDGVYTGSVADAFYGPLQVKAIIRSGKVVDVQFIQYPNDRQTSISINAQAMPLLEKEAIKVQSAQVEGVTGATQTSKAFIESLDSALNQAL